MCSILYLMTLHVEELLQKLTAQLETAGITTARLDTLVLMEDMLDRDRSWILAHPEEEVAGDLAEVLTVIVEAIEDHLGDSEGGLRHAGNLCGHLEALSLASVPG